MVNVIETPISGLVILEPNVHGDERGVFFEAYSPPAFAAVGISVNVAQINHSESKAGVLRGLHFQAPPNDQSKLVQCLRGKIFDVGVDLRVGSPTYGEWFGIELSHENKKMLFIPSGFAHGFYAMTDCQMLYVCGNAGYAKESEGGLRYDDPEVAIAWPFEGREPIVNERDRNFPTLAELKSPFAS